MMICSKDQLPSEKQKELMGQLLEDALVEIRFIAREGKGQQASDLADVFHNVPREIYGCGLWRPQIFRRMLQDYQDKYHSENCPVKFDYVTMFNKIYPES